MVFHGKPSKACAECRQRRTRCDLLKPSCSQCIRAKRTCPGYREGLIIHDESETLFAKHKGQATYHNSGPSSSLSTAVSLTPAIDSTSSFAHSINISRLDRNIEPQEWIPSMILAPSTSTEDQATCFFFGNYVLGTEMLNTCGNFQYLSAIYARQSVGVPLRQAVSAIGLAGLSNFWQAPIIMTQARRAYCSALRLVNSGLCNVEEAKSDQTLVAIIMLSCYETNTSSGPQSMKSWSEHISGATALTRLRGKKSLSSPLARNIFYHLRNGIIASCIQRHTAVPASITELSKSSLQYESLVEAASTNLGLLITEHCALRASMKHSQDFENITNIVTSLWELDVKYLNWSKSLPPEFIFAQVPAPDGTQGRTVYGNHYNTYSSIWVAGIWNNYSCVRILANELLRDQVSRLLHGNDMPDPPEIETDQGPVMYETILATAISTITTLTNNIFSSVPFFLSTTAQDTPRTGAGNLLLWPFYLAAQTTVASDAMRGWAVQRLGYIANTMGIRQAVPMAQTLRTTFDVEELADSIAEMSMKDALYWWEFSIWGKLHCEGASAN